MILYNNSLISAINQKKLKAWVQEALAKSKSGKLPTYIPLLANPNPNNFALALHSI